MIAVVLQAFSLRQHCIWHCVCDQRVALPERVTRLYNDIELLPADALPHLVHANKLATEAHTHEQYALIVANKLAMEGITLLRFLHTLCDMLTRLAEYETAKWGGGTS